MKNNWKSWVMAARPRTLTAILAPVILGTSVAAGRSFSLWVALLTLGSGLLLQVATNLVNDYYDSVHGVDTSGRLGPVRVVQSGLLQPLAVRRAFLFCFIAAIALGIPLVIRGGWVILLIGLASALVAWLYTGGPWPLSYLGLGEVAAFVFFGPVAVFGTFFLQTGVFAWEPLLVGAGPGFLAAFLMSINNLRDINTDRETGKRSIAVRLGEKQARMFSLGLLALAMATPLFYALVYPGRLFCFATCFTFLFFLNHWKRVATGPVDEELNLSLAAAGKLFLVYSLTWSLGMVL